MLIRRRKVTIEVEQRTVRIELIPSAAAVSVVGADAPLCVEPAAPGLPRPAEVIIAKTLEPAREL